MQQEVKGKNRATGDPFARAAKQIQKHTNSEIIYITTSLAITQVFKFGLCFPELSVS